ncbi:MAG: CIA30 family protein [Flavobacteriales bacterium]|nr:CIA30 family protein [Flavobacteriales bacterium]
MHTETPIEKPSSTMIFNFNPDVDASNWFILNDGVMGGESAASVRVNEEGNGVFEGNVSTANNGGFASVRYRPESLEMTGKNTVSFRIKGDGKPYQFRVKKKVSDKESFITTFQTSGEWETISIPLNELYPSYRGRKLDQPNYDATELSEICFLIANERNETFKLLIDHISIES